ncbi:hypothetical protein KDN24_16035 [Bacillus sp. Bva_UNVM-123]|uniref:hypothetical protein n=1 Tax=Bacillus sp. Bva_UNVM-123 TaxID=2829798 RepID=UPI00391F87D6
MEKYYCERCCLLYNKEELCQVCDIIAKKKIIIEVQKQKNPFKNDITEQDWDM